MTNADDMPCDTPHWGSFNGYTPDHEAVCFIVRAQSPNPVQPELEDLFGTVLVSIQSGHGDWQTQVGHRKFDEPGVLWFDGNPTSPLHSATYRLANARRGTLTETSEQQEWRRVEGGPNAPEKLLYER